MVHISLARLRIAFIGAALAASGQPGEAQQRVIYDETKPNNPNVSVILSTDTGKIAMTNSIPGSCAEAARELFNRYKEAWKTATAVGFCADPRTDRKTDISCARTLAGELACKGS